MLLAYLHQKQLWRIQLGGPKKMPKISFFQEQITNQLLDSPRLFFLTGEYNPPTTTKNIITFSSLSVVFGLDSIEKTYVYSKIEVHLTSPEMQKKAKHNKPKMTIEKKKKVNIRRDHLI